MTHSCDELYSSHSDTRTHHTVTLEFPSAGGYWLTHYIGQIPKNDLPWDFTDRWTDYTDKIIWLH